MCGICGLVRLDEAAASGVRVKRMTDALEHRGPDEEGIYVDGIVGLGHRRLSIIDLSKAGVQPMQTKDGRYVISYNGEAYNFNELRAELQALGYHFHSRTDTEVILHGFAEWGEKVVERLNGMFAFAILDKAERTLFLARDRYGIKPLYYTFQNDVFLFASEQKAMLATGLVDRAIDQEALLEYFTFQNIFTDKTLLKGVHLFPAATTASLKLTDPKMGLRFNQYWDYDFREPDKPISQEECREELAHLFRQAVNRQLVSDVEIGSYLSGGVDSGGITAIASSQLPCIKTFTCGFDLHSASGIELAFDEREKSEHLSYLFQTEHYEMVLKAGDMERALPKLARHIEEPRVGQSYPNYYAAHLASKFCKVVLAGTGGDELFGGYPWRYYRAEEQGSFSRFTDAYYAFWQRLIPDDATQHIFAPHWNEVKDINTRDIFRGVFKKDAELLTRPEDYINHSLYFEAKTFLHGLLLVEDKLSMAHGLETRVPFLDNDLVDFAMQIPVQYKLGDLLKVKRINENEPGKRKKHFQKTREGKIIFREMISSLVPDKVSNRAKQGFSGPDASWFKGDSIEFVKRLLFSDSARIYNHLDRVATQRLIKEHLSGKKNRRLLIWSLLNFEYWLKTYLGE